MNLENDFVLDLLRKTGNDIYLVGGVVRDLMLNRENHDKDIIVCDIPAEEFARRFADENNASFICLDKENNIYRVVLEDKINYVDVTNSINNSLEEDIKRRDLTINSIAINLKTGEVLDLLNGVEDLKKGVIKVVSEQNVIDDSLRILRVYRFASVLGFHIDSKTREIIRKHKDLIVNPAQERKNVEILKLFGGKDAHKVILEMDNDGLIDILFPIMLDVKKVPANSHHHLDLFNHSVETVKQIQSIYENSLKEVKEHLNKIDFGGDTRLAHLKFAGFLHDIGKFTTWTIENGRHRFIRHDEIGAEIAKSILQKQKFSKKQIEYITFIIRHHIYPSNVIAAPNITDKIYMRYVRKAGDNAIDLITVAKADRLSAKGPDITEQIINDNISGLDKLQNFYIKIKPTLKPLPKLLSGYDIMKLKHIQPSKVLGEIVNCLHEAQIDGVVQTKEDAINFVNKYDI